jgi:CBS domain-containing protein
MPNRPVSSIVAQQRIVTTPATTTVAAAARMMQECRVGAVMVVDGERLAGIFTERDALFRVIAAGRSPESTRLSEVMTTDPQTIGADKPFGHALHLMYEGGFRHVPVVEDGRPIGMISARDALAPELREFALELEDREHIGEIL